MFKVSHFKSTLGMYPQNPSTKTQGEPLFSYDDAYAEVPSLLNLRSVNLPKACGLRGQAWPRFYLTQGYLLKKYYFTQGMWSEEPSMTKVLCDIHTSN